MSWLPYVVDGLLLGSTIALGAVGTHAHVLDPRLRQLHARRPDHVGRLLRAEPAPRVDGRHRDRTGPVGRRVSFGWPFLGALALAMLLTAAVAPRAGARPVPPASPARDADHARHRELRRLARAPLRPRVRLRPRARLLHARDPARDARRAGLPAVRATPDQLFVLGLTAILVVALHLLLTRTTLGRAMRAVSENSTLARVVGVDPPGHRALDVADRGRRWRPWPGPSSG